MGLDGIAAERRQMGRLISQSDARVATIARSRRHTIATGNVGDCVETGIELIDPWADKTQEFRLEGLADGAIRDPREWAMSDPERLRPSETRQTVRQWAAATFFGGCAVAMSLQSRSTGRHSVPAPMR